MKILKLTAIGFSLALGGIIGCGDSGGMFGCGDSSSTTAPKEETVIVTCGPGTTAYGNQCVPTQQMHSR